MLSHSPSCAGGTGCGAVLNKIAEVAQDTVILPEAVRNFVKFFCVHFFTSMAKSLSACREHASAFHGKQLKQSSSKSSLIFPFLTYWFLGKNNFWIFFFLRV